MGSLLFSNGVNKLCRSDELLSQTPSSSIVNSRGMDGDLYTSEWDDSTCFRQMI